MRRRHWVEGSGHASKNSHGCTSLYGPSIHSGPGPPTSIIDQKHAPTDMFTGQSDRDIFSIVVASSRCRVKLTKNQHTKEERSSLVRPALAFSRFCPGSLLCPLFQSPTTLLWRTLLSSPGSTRALMPMSESKSERRQRGHSSSCRLLHFLLIICCDVLW